MTNDFVAEELQQVIYLHGLALHVPGWLNALGFFCVLLEETSTQLFGRKLKIFSFRCPLRRVDFDSEMGGRLRQFENNRIPVCWPAPGPRSPSSERSSGLFVFSGRLREDAYRANGYLAVAGKLNWKFQYGSLGPV
jgi:hypothetical protein